MIVLPVSVINVQTMAEDLRCQYIIYSYETAVHAHTVQYTYIPIQYVNIYSSKSHTYR